MTESLWNRMQLNKVFDKNEKIRNLICPMILAMIFSCFVVFGRSFDQTGSWNLVITSDRTQMMRGICALMVYGVIFFVSLVILFGLTDTYLVERIIRFSDKKGNSKVPAGLARLGNKIRQCFQENPFVSAFSLLLLWHLPYMVISYPAIFMGDTGTQIIQMFPELGVLKPAYIEARLISEDVYLNGHHPVIHTVLIHLFLKLGLLFGSLNLGICVYAFTQGILFLAMVAEVFAVLVKSVPINGLWQTMYIVYYLIALRVQNYLVLVDKDTYYAMCMILFLTELFGLLREKDNQKKYVVRMYIFGVLMMCFRNDAKYILLVTTCVLYVFAKKMRKIMLGMMMLTIIFATLTGAVIYPLCKITPGSKREMLSVPFQQTARYVLFHEDEVTEEEWLAIEGVLSYEDLDQVYDPCKSDNVKRTFKELSTTQDLLRYFKAWGGMFFKHPGDYIQATIHNYYYYFYPGKESMEYHSYAASTISMEHLCQNFEPWGIGFSYPQKWNEYRSDYEELRTKLESFPVYNLLTKPFLYTWVLFLMFAYGIHRKNQKILCFMTLPMIVLGVLMLGPCNGLYGRYLFPFMAALPSLIIMPLVLEGDKRKHAV